MKKGMLSLILATSLVASTGFMLASCNKNPKTMEANAEEVYAIAAVTSAKSLSTLSGSKISQMAVFDENLKSDLNKYINMFDDIFDKEIKPTHKKEEHEVEVKNEIKTYNNIIEMTIDNVNYIMHYNEGKDVEIEEDAEDKGKEITSKLEGVMEVGKNQYSLKGKKVLEQEEDEKEISIEFETKDSAGNKIKVKQSFETEIEDGKEETEISYTYTIKNKKDNKEKTVEISMEQDPANKNKNELEIEFENNNVQKEFKIIKTADNKYEITLEKEDANEVESKVTYIITKNSDSSFEYELKTSSNN